MMRLRRREHAGDWELLALIDYQDAFDWDVAGHVQCCGQCARRLEEQRARSFWIHEQMQILETGEAPVTTVSFATLMSRVGEEQRQIGRGGGRVMSDLWGSRAARAASVVAVLVVMVTTLSFTPMRTVAEDLLRQMRVREFAAVTIPMDMVKPFESTMLQGMSDQDRERLHDDLAELGTFETTFNFDLEHLPQAMTMDEARSLYGDFAVPETVPEGFGDPDVYVTEAGSASYTLNVAKAQSLIDEMNIPIYSLPDPQQYPALTFAADIPSAAILHYTNAAQEHIVVGQMESPTLQIPEGIDMDMLREDILRFPLPSELIAQVRAIDRWEETLIIPVPEGARTENIEIEDEPGLVIESEQGSVVLWENDGILYAAAGQVPAETVVKIARSMK